MTYECINIGDSLYQDAFGDLQVLLAPDSGLEILPGGEGVGGVNIIEEQRAPSAQSYTPVIKLGASGYATATTMSSLGNGTLTGWYQQSGSLVTFGIYFLIGSTTTYGAAGTIFFSLPSTPYSTVRSFGTAFNVDASAALGYNWFVRQTNVNSTAAVILVNAADAQVTNVGTLSAAGDYIHIQGTYRVA